MGKPNKKFKTTNIKEVKVYSRKKYVNKANEYLKASKAYEDSLNLYNQQLQSYNDSLKWFNYGEKLSGKYPFEYKNLHISIHLNLHLNPLYLNILV